MIIIYDSNIVCSNFYMRGPSFEMINRVGTVVWCQIVIDEVLNKYREKLDEQLKRTRKEVNELNRMIDTNIDLTFEGMADLEYEKYKSFLEMIIIEGGAVIPEKYPDDTHEEVVRRALERKKPFKEDGSTGYRDYLVWLTCLNVAEEYPDDEIHFISSNTRDFADVSDREKLHPDLLQDLQERNINETRFHFWNSIKSFVDKHVKACVEQIDKEEKLCRDIEDNHIGFQTPIDKFIEDNVVGLDISREDIIVPGEKVVLKELNCFSDYEIENIAVINKEDYLLDVVVHGLGTIDCWAEKTSISEFEECGFDIQIIEQTKDNRCILRTILGMHVHLRAIYESSTQKITSLEIDYIEDDNCPFCD